MLNVTNTEVLTPLGKGVVQFPLLYDDFPQVVVRLAQPGSQDPRCLTPRATKTSLWKFFREDLKEAG